MNLDFHSNSLTGLKKQVSLLLFTCAALSVSSLILVGALASQHDRIVVVPPGLSGPVTIDWGRADTEYMKTFGIFFATMLGTITPRNAEYVADRLSGMTSADAYPQIRKSILAVARDPNFSTSGSASNFVSNQVVFERETGKVFVTGENQVHTGFGQPKISAVVYEMEARIIEGRPIMMSVINYPGTEARTAEWKLTHPNWNKPAVEQ